MDKALYSVIDVCHCIVNYCNGRNYSLSNLKLQKILYFVQAYFIKFLGRPCFKEEIEAWDFGPVVPEAYHEYKHFGGGEIIGDGEKDSLTTEDGTLVRAIVNVLAKFSATELVSITHKQDPWIRNYVPRANNPISNEDLKEYFRE